MSLQEKPEAAFALSLAGGMLMLICGIITYMWFMFRSFSMMERVGVFFGFMASLFIIGLISGIVVTFGAIMLNVRPEEHVTFGTIILVFSIISFLGMGGFFIGAVLGIVGGALAIAWQPRVKA